MTQLLTTVVNMKTAEFDVYIGRKSPRHPASPFANPSRIEPGCSRTEALERYEQYITARLAAEPELRLELEKLRGKRLGCYCKPRDCHGDILVRLLHPERDEAPPLKQKELF